MGSTTVPRQLIRDFLMRDPAMQALVQDRIHGRHLKDADIQNAKFPACIFEFLSGSSHTNRLMDQPTFELYGWSKKSGDEASLVYDAAYNRLQSERVFVDGIDLCGWAVEVQRPVDIQLEAIGAWAVRGRWIITTV